MVAFLLAVFICEELFLRCWKPCSRYMLQLDKSGLRNVHMSNWWLESFQCNFGPGVMIYTWFNGKW